MWQVRQLEAFHFVMVHGSLTRAGKMLNISQPAVSKLISSLERACGFKLFSRNGNRLTVTAEGELLYTEVQRILLGTNEIKRKADEIRDQSIGTLSIAAFPALTSRALPKIVTRFMLQHRNVRPLITTRSSAFLVDWLTAQKSDLGIGLLAIDTPGVRFVRIMQVEGVCVIPVAHELNSRKVITPHDLSNLPFIGLYTEARTTFAVNQFFESQGIRPNIVIETQSSETACQFVAQGAGVSIVDPFSTFGFHEDEISIRQISPSVMFDVWLMFPTFRPTSLITKSFVAFLSEELQQLLKNRSLRYAPCTFVIPD